MDTALPSRFLAHTFHSADRIAMVLLHRPTGRVVQRLALVKTVVGRRWQAWLRYLNAHGHDVYYSVNTYHAKARARTKTDLQSIRHLFLDVDSDAGHVLNAVRSDPTLPRPHHIVRSSVGRCQLLWRVEGFSVRTIEALQHGLATRHGTDRAATDAARVARLPGFWNCKYQPRPFVTVASATRLDSYTPADFPNVADAAVSHTATTASDGRAKCRGSGVSRSERDWSWVIRQLAAGRPLEQIEAALIRLRPDKRNPSDYAARTVDAAWADLSLIRGLGREQLVRILVARRATRPNARAYAAHIVQRAAIRCASRRESTPAAFQGGRDVNYQHDV
jgi:hypothetical protein